MPAERDTYISNAATTMFIAWQYPTSSFVQLYAVKTRRSLPMPASSWKPGYSGRLRLRSFSISSIARDSRPENFASVSVYRFGFCRRRKNEPEVSSHTSPRNLFGRPTRISLWKVGWRISVAPRPFSAHRQTISKAGRARAYLANILAITESWWRPLICVHFRDI